MNSNCKMPMKLLKPAVAMVAAVALSGLISGCQSGPSYPPGFDFSRYHTFALLPLPTTGTFKDPTIAVRLGPFARAAVVETLTAKGFQEAPDAQADFLVQMLFDYYPASIPGENRIIEKRRLEIRIIDRQSQKPVWSAEEDRTTAATLPPDESRKLIAGLLSSFPPPSRRPGP